MEMQDKIKLIVAVLVIALGVVGFYMIPESQGLLRVVVFLGSVLMAAGVAWFSEPGKGFVRYAQDSIAEGRKVVWPTRREAVQITAMVALFVFVLALFMWLVDTGLAWLFYQVILG